MKYQATILSILLAFIFVARQPCLAQAVPAHEQSQLTFEAIKAEGTLIGQGGIKAYELNGQVLLAIPASHLNKLFLWYAEAVSLPAEAVSSAGLEIGTLLVSLERHGNTIMVRDHTAGSGKRSGTEDSDLELGQYHTLQPIQVSINSAAKGPIIAVFPLVAESKNGDLMINITDTFTNDISSLTALPHIHAMGLENNGVAADRSYISKVQVSPTDIIIRSHLTFWVTNPADPDQGVKPLSMEIGHSMIQLPATPLAGRTFDKRVGFFTSQFTSFESSQGKAVTKQAVILRYRLEKLHPKQAVSPPVKPIVFYIGQEVPQRWRPYIKAGIEQWQPVFTAAGFSNAIIAADAPTITEAPDWSAENAHHSTVRWLSQAHPNAMGPSIYDPRSGEIFSSHIQLWPGVIEIFEQTYYAIASSLDPRAASLPMSEKMQGQLLQYVVAHEVGHAIGLRHNHLASTAYTVAQMRNPAFANKHGANASIMAYGRFNQAAQPGDGVTRIIPVIGPYDYFAINWGYGVHGDTPQKEQAALNNLATRAQNDRSLLWAAGEMIDEMEIWGADPRLQYENTGAERLLATKLGVANILRSLANLDKATAGNNELYAQTYKELILHQRTFILSVAKIIGGMIRQHPAENQAAIRLIPAEQQREAVHYLLSEAPASFEIYKKPGPLARVQPIGGIAALEQIQSSLVTELLSGPRLTMLANQKSIDPEAYGPLDLGADMMSALWGDLANIPAWRKAQQRAFLTQLSTIFSQEAEQQSQLDKQMLQSVGFSFSFSMVNGANGTDTLFPAWLRATLPNLQIRLSQALDTTLDKDSRLHLQDMIWRIQKLRASL